MIRVPNRRVRENGVPSTPLERWRPTGSLRYVIGGAIIGVVASLVVIMSFINQPNDLYDPDAWIYLAVANNVAHGHFVDRVRTPGYPLFIDVVMKGFGLSDPHAFTAAQSSLFVLAAIGTYALVAFITRRAWIALVTALPVALSVELVSFARPIMSEGLAIFLVTCLALAFVWYVRSGHISLIWAAIGILFALAMTKPEWVYFSVLFAGALALVARWQGTLRRALPHIAVALMLFVGLCGLYAYGNARHGYLGFGANQNVDLLAKVMQYHMQNEAPPQYARITSAINTVMARGSTDPWDVVHTDPALEANWYALDAKYGWSVILHHPVEYAADTLVNVYTVLRDYGMHPPGFTNGPFGGPLALLLAIGGALQPTLLIMPLVALSWWLWVLRRKKGRKKASELSVMMGGLSLMCMHSLAINATFGFVQYARIESPVTPLMYAVVWASVIVVASTLGQRVLAWWRGRRSVGALAASGAAGG